MKTSPCPDCENGQVEVIDTGSVNGSIDTWLASYPKLKTVDCETCGGTGEVTSFAIAAHCHSDCQTVDIEFDAVDWFKQCSASDLKDLIDCDWRGDYPADDVARFFEDSSTAPLFQYVATSGEGFECYVNEDDAIAWLEEHRPELLEQVQEVAIAPSAPSDAAALRWPIWVGLALSLAIAYIIWVAA